MLGAAAWVQGKAWLGQHLLERSWETARQSGRTAPPPWPWADTRPIARLRVPELGIDQFVLDGATGRHLAWGPVHVAPSAVPGHPGHVVLSAHRDTHFGFLGELQVGDDIGLEQADGDVRRYATTGKAVVDQRSERLALQSDRNVLSLTTCEPTANALAATPLRLVVSATPLPVTPSSR